MKPGHIVAIVAIPTTLLVVSQAVQGTSQAIDAIDDDSMRGDSARARIRSMSWFAGGALVLAALAGGDLATALTTLITAAIVVFMFNRITMGEKVGSA